MAKPKTAAPRATAARQPRTPSPAHRAIEEDHRVLRDLLGRIETSADLCALRELMHEIRPLLVAHFQRVEDDTGFPDIVRDHVPSSQHVLDELITEHRAILDGVSDLERRIHELLEGPAARLFREGVELAERLRDHERRETDLLLDVMTTDMGTKD